MNYERENNQRTQRAELFRETMRRIRTNPVLTASVNRAIANTRVYWEKEYPFPGERIPQNTRIAVTSETTVEAAIRLYRENPGQRIAVLNFGGCRHRGGGVVRGARGQEEDLCRSSTLYPVLQSDAAAPYYGFHRAHYTPEATDALIYSEGIRILDRKREEWIPVDVITMAAPNLRHGWSMSEDAIYRCHKRRMEHLLNVAAGKGVDILVLGAFGCGAYKNPPAVVAQAMKDAVSTVRGVFSQIDFAIPCGGGHRGIYYCFRGILAE